MIATKQPIGVAGAGSIGCFVGGVLADAGRRVSLLARPRVIVSIGWSHRASSPSRMIPRFSTMPVSCW
jgi:choline dehydrogenase-like flavoprotein